MSARDERQARIEEELARLRRAVEDLQTELATVRQAAQPLDQRQHSRRDLLRLGGAALLGAAGAAGASALAATPALANAGGNFILGQTNTSDVTTVLEQQTMGPTPMLEVFGPGITALPMGTQQGFNGAVVGVGPSTKDGVDGFASGTTGAGVVGQSDSGYGVIGAAGTGLDLAGLGSGRLFLRSLASAGPPGFSSTAGGGEMTNDPNQVIWVSDTSTGWRRLNTLRVDNAAGTGPFVPVRVINTDGAVGPIVGGITGPLTSGNTYTWSIAGANGIPANAIGIVGNITAVAYTSGGFLTMFPAGTTRPVVSSVNFGDSVFAWGNHFTVGFGSGVNAGKISIFIGLNNNGVDTCHVIVDVFGYMQ